MSSTFASYKYAWYSQHTSSCPPACSITPNNLAHKTLWVSGSTAGNKTFVAFSLWNTISFVFFTLTCILMYSAHVVRWGEHNKKPAYMLWTNTLYGNNDGNWTNTKASKVWKLMDGIIYYPTIPIISRMIRFTDGKKTSRQYWGDKPIGVHLRWIVETECDREVHLKNVCYNCKNITIKENLQTAMRMSVKTSPEKPRFIIAGLQMVKRWRSS